MNTLLQTKNSRWLINLLIIAMVLSLATLLIVAFWQQPMHDSELRDLTLSNINNSGVSNPVTAVLLNFRAYDTFIEFAVFLCVAVAVLPYVPDFRATPGNLSPESQALIIAKVFVPLSIVMAGYLLWIGSTKPGGAFQAASLLAGCLVSLSLANVNFVDFAKLTARLLLSVGLLVFALVATLVMIQQQNFLTFPVEMAGLLILVVEFFATLAIGLTLFLCFESINKGHL